MSNEEDVPRTDHSTVPVKIPKRVTEEVYNEKSEVTCKEVNTHGAEKEHKMLYLAESVNEYDVSALPEVEEIISQAVAKEGSSTYDVIDAAEVGKETVRKKSQEAIST